VIITGLAAWRLGPKRFRAIPWPAFAIGSALFWGLFAALMLAYEYWGVALLLVAAISRLAKLVQARPRRGSKGE
jgi:hypothetical protein